MGTCTQSIWGRVGLWLIKQAEPRLAPGDCETTYSRCLGFVYFFNYCFCISRNTNLSTLMPKKVNSAAMYYLLWGAVTSCASKSCMCNRSACRYRFTSNLFLACSVCYWALMSCADSYENVALCAPVLLWWNWNNPSPPHGSTEKINTSSNWRFEVLWEWQLYNITVPLCA